MKTYEEIAGTANKMLSEFGELIADVPYEAKGVLYSEMLFMLACLEGKDLSRILESGRARGQSTLLLARALPKVQIVSIEYHAQSVDVPVAEARLRGLGNVELLFGDARRLLPQLIVKDEVIIIDGPKMFRAIRLALSLLATKKVSQVFLHDLSLDTPERKFLDRHMPECRFSDARVVAVVTSKVDREAFASIPSHQRLDGITGEYGYGFSLGCIPYMPGRSYRFLWVIATIHDLIFRIKKKLNYKS